MEDVRQGDTVALNAQFADGAFPDEYLVTFPTIDGEVSGFVKQGNAVRTVAGKPVLVGQVQEITNAVLTLFVRGSFFTNSGYVKVRGDQMHRILA